MIQATFIDKITKYVPTFVDTAADAIKALIAGISTVFVSVYDHILSITESENTGRGLLLRAGEEQIMLSGRETETEIKTLLGERYPINTERGTINGIIKDIGYLTNQRAGKVIAFDATDQYAELLSDIITKSEPLLSNHTFIDGNEDSCPTNWISPTNNVVKTSVEHYEGNYSAKMSIPASGKCYFYQDLIGKPNILYTLSFASKIPTGKSVTCRVTRCKGEDLSNAIDLLNVTLNGTDNWETHSHIFEYPRTEDDVLRIQFEAQDDEFTAYIDNVILQEDHEFTIGIWIDVPSALEGISIVFHKADSETGKGFGLIASDNAGELDLTFRLNDGVNTDMVSYPHYLKIIEGSDFNRMHLVLISVGKYRIRISVDGLAYQAIDRTAYGDYRSSFDLTFFKSSADNSGHFMGYAGDIQILIDQYDADDSIAQKWYSRGMDIHHKAHALWRAGAFIGVDQTIKANDLTIRNIETTDILQLGSSIPPAGYPSYPSIRRYYNDLYSNRTEIGWWVGRTFIGQDKILMGTDAVIESEIVNNGKLSSKEVDTKIRESILPMDVQLLKNSTEFTIINLTTGDREQAIPDRTATYDRSRFDEATYS